MSSTGSLRTRFGAGLLALVCFAAAVEAAAGNVAVRRPDLNELGTNNYEADFTRAYEECTTPNETSSDGIPACSPPVTSACDFDAGDMRLRWRSAQQTIELRAALRDVSGPGACTTGPYTLGIVFRVSADDATCTGGTCTWIDVPLVFDFDAGAGDNFAIDPVNIETVLNGIVPGIDTDDLAYEVRSVVVTAPDGLVMAAAGLGSHGANRVTSNLGTHYPECTVPNDTNNVGVPACAPAVWAHTCDVESGRVQWQRTGASSPPEFVPVLLDLAGAAPACTTGTYQFETTLRITTADCAGIALPCTLVDVPVLIPVTPTKSDVDDLAISMAEIGFTGPIDSFEVRSVRLLEPSGAPILAAGVSNAWHLHKTRFQVGRKKLDVPNDDQLKIAGFMADVPAFAKDVVPDATVTVSDDTGVVYTVTIPSAAWETAGSGASWRYKDKTGALNGVRKATLKRSATGGNAGYALKLQAMGLDLSAITYPGADVVVTLAGDGTSLTAKGNRTCKAGIKTLNCR